MRTLIGVGPYFGGCPRKNRTDTDCFFAAWGTADGGATAAAAAA
jgi:hypothetical protein